MKTHVRAVCAGLFASMALCGAADASLVGDSIGSVMKFPSDLPGRNTWDRTGATAVGTPITSVVGAGPEYSVTYTGTYTADFGADSLRIQLSGGPFSPIGDNVLWSFTDLNFSAGPIANVFLDATNFSDVHFSWTSDSLEVSIVNQSTPSVAFMDFRFVAGAQAVPEPGSLALLGLGLAGLVILRKRRA